MQLYLVIGLSILVALAVSFVCTPAVKRFAHRVGAIDIPEDSRRMHTKPTPRLGGLAIFIGFLLSVIIFSDITTQIRGILIGALIIVIVGVIDDIVRLRALVKLFVQILAALVAVYHGVVIEAFSNPLAANSSEFILMNSFSIPITVFWIVAITNSVNLIDGLDGLAAGVSIISSVVMLIISLIASESNAVVLMAALAGACLGFLPYNFNPAKIFMGDTGALLLGYVLATVSILGLFKYAMISFAAPFLALALPLFDTSFAFLRRLLKGKNPMSPDRGHLHHRLIDVGLSQKQAVVTIYSISGLFGIAAIIVAVSDRHRVLVLMLVLIIAIVIGLLIYLNRRKIINSLVDTKNTAGGSGLSETGVDRDNTNP